MAESLGQLVEIVAAFEESYEADGGAGGAASSEAEFAPVLAAAVDPLVEMCERSAEALTPDAPSRLVTLFSEQRVVAAGSTVLSTLADCAFAH